MDTQTLILIPGLLCDATVWQHQIDHLTNIETIIVPDLSNVATVAEMVQAVLDVAPQTFCMAGHSMGGWVALEVMRIASHRVQRLCLVNTTAFADSPEKTQARLDMIALVEKGDHDAVIARLLKVFLYQQACLPTVTAMLKRNIGSFIYQERAMLNNPGCESVLPKIHIPTLVIQSTEDQVFHLRDAESLHQQIIGSKLAQIEAAGHMSPMEAPEKVTALMQEWLL